MSKLSWTYAPPISRSGFANAQFSGLLHGRSPQWESLSQMAYLQDAWQLAISKKILSRQLASLSPYLNWSRAQFRKSSFKTFTSLHRSHSWVVGITGSRLRVSKAFEHWVSAVFPFPHDYKFLWTRQSNDHSEPIFSNPMLEEEDFIIDFPYQKWTYFKTTLVLP